MTGESFEYSNPRVERVISGRGVIRRLGQEVERLGGSRALIVTSPSVVRSDIFNGLREGLGSRCVGSFDRVRPHSPTEVIEEAAEEFRKSNADVLVSVGGGSAIDTAKGVAVLLAEGGPLPRFGVRFTPPNRKEVPDLPRPKLPHLALPSTLSAGVYSYAVVTTVGVKNYILVDTKFAPQTVLLDRESVRTVA